MRERKCALSRFTWKISAEGNRKKIEEGREGLRNYHLSSEAASRT